jgi:amino acid adenylation domain-containing protein/thioester reductase-like protein
VTPDESAVDRGESLADESRADAVLRQRLLSRRENDAAQADEPARSRAVTSAQARMFFLHQVTEQQSRYHVSEETRIRGPLQPSILQQALDVLLRWHEMLRSGFTHSTTIERIVVESARVPLRRETVPRGPRQADAVSALLSAFATQPFDLGRPPLLRAMLIRLHEDEHLLCIVFHHIVCDGWSIGILNRQLGLTYAALRSGHPFPAPPPSITPAELARREQEYLDSPRAGEARSWWVRELADSAGTPLPFAVPRGDCPPSGTTYTVVLNEQATKTLEQLAANQHTSLYGVICAAVTTYVYRCTGEADITVGSPAANRDRPDLRNLVALVANTIALRFRCGDARTFRQMVDRCGSVILTCLDHQAMPFEQVVAAVAPQRQFERNPLFQLMVAHQNVDSEPPELAGTLATREPGRPGRVQLDLEITTWRRRNGLEVRVGGRAPFYDRETVERIAGHMYLLLTQVGQHPDEPLDRLTIMPAQERRTISGWERGPIPAPDGPSTLHGMFAAQAACFPSAPALQTSRGIMSFADLSLRALQVADTVARGAGRGDVVGIAVERDESLVASMLGVLRAGAAFVPLNLADPVARRRAIVADAGVRAVIVTPGTGEWLPAGVTAVDYPAQTRGDADVRNLAGGPAQDRDLVYLMYTSGTSGQPKGVLLRHRNLVNTLRACVRRENLGPGDLGLVLAAHTFDVFYHELFTPMLSGGCAYLVHPAEMFDTEAMGALLRRATSLQAVPGLMEQLTGILDLDGKGPSLSIRRVMTGGDSVPPRLFSAISRAFPAATSSVTYGPTEAAIFCTQYEVPASGTVTGRPLGSPIDGAVVRVADPWGGRIPIGAKGEIWVGGRGVSRGYHNRPQENAASFTKQNGMRYYQTGDWGRWRPDGCLEFLGRRDSQVKVRGVRIELAEIEAVATQAPGVRRCVAVTAGEGSGRRLDAYVTHAEPDGRPGIAPAVDGRRIQHWQHLFDEAYGRRNRQTSGDLDFTGWHSSLTDAPFTTKEMLDWRAGTLRRLRQVISDGARPGLPRVLEIGCGTGLVLLSLAPQTSSYIGTDISVLALSDLRSRLAGPAFSHVRLVAAAAHEAVAEATDVDLIVINSTVQYFPHPEYLRDLLNFCVSRLAPGGCIFVGDVRDLSLAREFYRSVGIARGVCGPALDEWVAGRVTGEEELLVSPAWFDQYASERSVITAVEVTPRLDRYDTEMSRYRYDVVLRSGRVSSDTKPIPAVTAAEITGGLDSLTARLTGMSSRLMVRSVAHPFRDRELTVPALAVLPAEVSDWAEGRGLLAAFSLNRSADGDYDLYLSPRSPAGTRPAGTTRAIWPARAKPAQLANDPSRRARDLSLEESVRDHLTAHLPSYMRPATVTALPRLPLTPHGKLDRDALPPPRQLATSSRSIPTEAEEPIFRTWAEVLGNADFSVEDDFFEVGGTSLTAIELAVRLRSRSVSVTPQEIFEHRTIARLSAMVAQHPAGGTVPAMATGTDLPAAHSARPHDPGRRSGPSLREARRVLLTGATGMLGIHVLYELLQRTSADIACLVRAPHVTAARERLAEQYRWYFPDANMDSFSLRVHPVAGDLRTCDLRRLLRDEARLDADVEHIVHCAADVRHVADRAEIMATNVTGTQRLLDLTQTSEQTCMHYVSTVGVAGHQDPAHPRAVLDERSLHIGQRPTETYSESKIAAEDLVRRHFAQGMAGTILRAGTVAPHSITGRFQRDIGAHFFSRYLRSTLALGLISDRPGRELRLVPADLMAQAVVELANAYAGQPDSTFHLDSPHPLNYSELAGILTLLGYPLRLVPHEQFASALDEMIRRGADPAIVGGLLPLVSGGGGVAVQLGSTMSRQALAAVGIQFPPVTREYVKSFIDDGVRRGYFRPAGRMAAPLSGVPGSTSGRDQGMRTP